MLEYARWKYLIIGIVCLAGLLYAVPNLFPQDPAVQISANRGFTVDDALKERAQGVLDEAKIGFKSLDLDAKKARLLIRLLDGQVQTRAADALRAELGQGYNVALNLAPTVPRWLGWVGARPMTLGLDLQGGVHFLMEVDQRATIQKQELRLEDDTRTLLRDEGIRYRSVARNADGGLKMTFPSGEERDRAFRKLSTDMLALELVDGPETEAGFVLDAKVKETETKAAMDRALEQNISTLRNRIFEIAPAAEPIIQRQGSSRIVVQLPGVQDTALARKILGATATLEYRAVDMTGDVNAAVAGRVPPASRLYYDRDNRPVLLSRRLIVSGDQLIDAASGFDQQSGEPMVSVVLNNAGAARMQSFTNDNVGNGMAVVYIERLPDIRMVDGKEVRTTREKQEVISIANVREPFGKRFQTTGLDSSEEASELAMLLRAGALAAPVDIVEERIVGPSLGAENIRKGWNAVLYSFGFVLIFFVVYYKTFGVITNIALLLNLVLVVAVMSLLGATLTLPGLAGIALTVGLSVDANVLINERIREELRAGNSPLASIAAGYDKASGTIADANVTALLAAIALWVFGSGPIQGFAVSLFWGILTSMYTAVSVSRGIAALVYGGRRRKVTHVSI